MTKILAVHRQKPNWPADPTRPITAMGDYFVETDGGTPTMQQVIDVVLGKETEVTEDEITRLRSLGHNTAQLKIKNRDL